MNENCLTAPSWTKTTYCHCEEVRRLFAGPTKQSFLCLGRASVLASLLLLSSSTGYATQLANVDIIWRTPVPNAVQARTGSVVDAGRGKTVTESRLTRLIESTLSLLADHGYHHAVIEPQQFRLTNDSVSFELIISPGPVAMIAKWEFIGLVRTDSLWLAKALDLPTDVPATRAAMGAAIANVSAFSNLSLATPPEVVAVRDEASVVIRLNLREPAPARFEGALAAGSTEGADGGLLGRLSLGLDGLFRRDHSMRMRYEHPQPDERLLRLEYSERLALWRYLSTRLLLEDWRRGDHRQQAAAEARFALSRRHGIALIVGANWQKITPLSSTNAPARLLESSYGLSWSKDQNSRLALRGVYSRRRQWDRVTTLEDSHSRLRLEVEGSWLAMLGTFSRLRLSSGGRWWGGGGDLRPGDEWFLGGEILSGYPARSLAVGDGVWSRIEISHLSSSGFGVAVFGESAWLTMFDAAYRRPASVGLALLLDSPGRSGRLELAWKDRASVRDGILRLSVIQGW